MDSSNPKNALARRDFLRSATVLGAGAGLTGLMGACSDGNPLEVGQVSNEQVGAGWLRVDLADTSTGLFMSLDAVDVLGSTGDYEYHGYGVTPTGERFPLSLVMNRSYADTDALTWVADDLYLLEAEGEGQPSEVRLVERIIPGSNVVVVTGQVFDSVEVTRVSFSTTTAGIQESGSPVSANVLASRSFPFKRKDIQKWLKKAGEAAKAIDRFRRRYLPDIKLKIKIKIEAEGSLTVAALSVHDQGGVA